MATSGLEPMPISSLKHDPAWKHCQMFKNNDRVQLKCLYCFKMFGGGGIHRIKEHLACQKGNASCCPRVPADVRNLMLESLEVTMSKKRKKQKINEEDSSNNNHNNINEGNNVVQFIGRPNMYEEHPIVSSSGRNMDKRKRGRPRNSNLNTSLPLVNPEASCLRSNLNSSLPLVNPETSGLRSNLNSSRSLVNPNASSLRSTREKGEVHMAIGRFLYDVGMPLDAVNSPYFQPMIDTIASRGQGVEPISYHDLRSWVLKNSVEEVNCVLGKYRETWVRTRCSVLADEWTTDTGRILINFFVYCPEGTMFLKSVDVTQIVISVDSLYELLKGVVEEVGVRNVIQVITNSAEHYVIVGKRLVSNFSTLYWTPCASRATNLMLEDIGKIDWINDTLEHAKSITRYVYNHGVILNMMRRYTGGRDLVVPAVTRSATDFISLKSIVNLKDNLESMVTSQEWMACPLSKLQEGIAMMDIIFSQSFWSTCSVIIRLVDPLIGLLRTVGSHDRPAMGFVLAALYRAKQAIKFELVEKKEYMIYWNIIDNRWNRQLQQPLHQAGFFLNPKFFYSLDGDVRDEIPSGMLDCIERLVPDTKIQDKINKEMITYKNAVGDFGRKMAIRARETLLPAEWWSTYGGGCPNLARLAIHILSQTCSASMLKRNATPFDQIHRTRNHLECQRLHEYVFVHYNLRLQQIYVEKSKEPESKDPISSDGFDIVEDWVRVAEKDFFGDMDSEWVPLDQPLTTAMLMESLFDEPDDWVAGFKYQEGENELEGDEEDGRR